MLLVRSDGLAQNFQPATKNLRGTLWLWLEKIRVWSNAKTVLEKFHKGRVKCIFQFKK